MTPLVLGSTSIYRKELIEKLALPFKAIAPVCDEDSYKKTLKDPKVLAATLAREKAKSLATNDNCVIGGDQVVALDSEILGKPGTESLAIEQLSKMQGKTHELITALCVIHKGESFEILDVTRMHMRRLSREQIQDYVRRDKALDCAGSYKIEKSGMLLMEKIETEDFSAIQGVPLLALAKVLLKLGYPL
jgi:septum formation protein